MARIRVFMEVVLLLEEVVAGIVEVLVVVDVLVVVVQIRPDEPSNIAY